MSKSKDKNNNSVTNLTKIDYQSISNINQSMSVKNDNFFRSVGCV